MQTFSLIFLLVGALWLPAQAQQSHLDSSSTQNRPVFTVVEQQPEFPGGMNKLSQYFRTNLRYPEAARKARIQGRVFITFIVSEDGAIQQVRALKSVDPELDAEAVRLVQSMPNWKPARQGGQPVACRYNIPVNFAL
jgi:protein TonB